MFKAAVVGHSHVPRALRPDVPCRVDIFRSPGAKAKDFFVNPILTPVLRERYDLVILWLGSNDITDNSNPLTIAQDIQGIVQAIEKECGADVRPVLIEPRLINPNPPPHIHISDQETYEKQAKGINRKLQGRLLKRCRYISFGAKPFWDDLGPDGVHFRRPEREAFINTKFLNCIHCSYWDNQGYQALGQPVPVNMTRQRKEEDAPLPTDW